MESKVLLNAIDEHLIIKYAQGIATDDEKRLVEHAMHEDAFLSDAIEGLKESPNLSEISPALLSIKQQIATKSNYSSLSSGKTIKLPTVSIKALMGIAASLVILAGTYLIASTLIKNNKQIAQNKEVTKDEEGEKKEVVLSEKTITIEKPLVVLDATKTKETEAVLEEDIVSADRKGSNDVLTNNPITSSGSATTPSSTYNWTLPSTVNKNLDATKSTAIVTGQVLDYKTKKPIAGAKVVSGKTNTLSSANGYYEIALDDEVKEIEFIQPGYQDQAKKVSASGTINVELNQSFDADAIAQNQTTEEKKDANKQSKDELKNGLDKYSAQQYQEAILSFNKVLQNNPNSAEANYYNGLAYYNTKKPNKALVYLNKVIKANNKYSEDAKWQKAQILLQQNNAAEAKPILEELKNSSKYKVQSEQLLKTNK